MLAIAASSPASRARARQFVERVELGLGDFARGGIEDHPASRIPTSRGKNSRARPMSWRLTQRVSDWPVAISQRRRHRFPRPRGVDAGYRLVGQERLGNPEQRPGDRHPLLLAARESVGALVDFLRDPDLSEGRIGLIGRRCRREQERPQRAGEALLGKPPHHHVLDHPDVRH